MSDNCALGKVNAKMMAGRISDWCLMNGVEEEQVLNMFEDILKIQSGARFRRDIERLKEALEIKAGLMPVKMEKKIKKDPFTHEDREIL